MHWFRVTQVRCDLLDVARAYLPAGFDLVRETELLCRSRADPHSAKDASGDRSAPAGTPTFSSSSSAAAAAAAASAALTGSGLGAGGSASRSASSTSRGGGGAVSRGPPHSGAARYAFFCCGCRGSRLSFANGSMMHKKNKAKREPFGSKNTCGKSQGKHSAMIGTLFLY